MNRTGQSWQKEESKILFRDLIFLIITILLSILIAEQIIIKEKASLVDRVFSYLLIFIPFGIINLIAHYYYRNRRIRLTGNLRTSLRYRLSLAFMLVAIIPSIPIFLISSNMVEELVKGIFRIDVAGALDSANKIIFYFQKQKSDEFLEVIRSKNPGLFRSKNINRQLTKDLYSSGILRRDQDYAGLISHGKIVYETRPLFTKKYFFSRKKEISSEILSRELTINKKGFAFYRFPLVKSGEFLIIGRQMYPELKNDFSRFNLAYFNFKRESIWRDKIPYTLRLGVALVYLFMICFSLAMAWVIARRISRPIVILAQAARDVTDGKLDTKLDIHAQGEMGLLIDSFNQMTIELRSLKARLLHSQRVAVWQEVAQRLAHEIKNPLTPIQLYSERMLRRLKHPEKGNLDEIVHSGATAIMEQVNVLKFLVKEFADFARMPTARPTPHSLDSIVTEAVNLFKDTSDVPIEMRLDGNLPQIPLDKNILIGMINNLIKNGIEAIKSNTEMQQRDPKLLINTGIHREGVRKFVTLKVGDSGPGIDETMRDKIFEPYFSTKGGHGNGHGLVIVERAVMEHDARISVGKSELGGAEFVILFRIRTDQGT